MGLYTVERLKKDLNSLKERRSELEKIGKDEFGEDLFSVRDWIEIIDPLYMAKKKEFIKKYFRIRQR